MNHITLFESQVTCICCGIAFALIQDWTHVERKPLEWAHSAGLRTGIMDRAHGTHPWVEPVNWTMNMGMKPVKWTMYIGMHSWQGPMDWTHALSP